MRYLVVLFSVILFSCGSFAQTVRLQDSSFKNPDAAVKEISDSVKGKTGTGAGKTPVHSNLFQSSDTLTLSDYMMSIERVNDQLNTIQDSSRIPFEVVIISRNTGEIANDISIIRESIRGRHSVVNIKNLYLYQNLAADLNDQTEKMQTHINSLYNRVYHARLQLRTVFSDSVFQRLRTDNFVRDKVEARLNRLERKWVRNDSILHSNIDSLNSLKVRIAENSMNLTNMLNILDYRLDRTGHQLFGQEEKYLWQGISRGNTVKDPSAQTVSKLTGERKAIGFYLSHSQRKRSLVGVLGILLLIWLFRKRKMLKSVREQKESFNFLNIQYLKRDPLLSILLILICLMPFFDAYASTSFIVCEYIVLLAIASVIFIEERGRSFLVNWIVLVVLFVADALTYVFIEPGIGTRWWLLLLYSVIIVSAFRFYRSLDKQLFCYKWIKIAAKIGIFLTGLGILCNIFGRVSLSGILGFSGIFAITQAVILPVFMSVIIEMILFQLYSSRLKKGVKQPFDRSVVINKTIKPLFLVTAILWLIMLASNLNIYYNLSSYTADLLTAPRTIGNISYKLINVIWFFVIIWAATILQRMVSFLFGETGIDAEDMTSLSKKQHSRLLITRLLVLIGGYLLAIAASGLPLDKLTIILGALGVGVGMGLQNVVNNFVSGIILIFDGSLQIGDQIEVNGLTGKVKEIGLRASTLSTADGAEIIIPNGSILSQNIVNWTFSNDEKRVTLKFSLTGKELDTNVINEVINNIVTTIPKTNSQKKPVILYSKVTREKSWLIVKFWSTIDYADKAQSEALLQLNAAFTAMDIEFK